MLDNNDQYWHSLESLAIEGDSPVQEIGVVVLRA